MIGKSPDQRQREIFRPLLSDFIDMSHELVLLSKKIDWRYFETEFSALYSNTGQPAIAVRFMVGCMILKRLYNLGDETLEESWKMNPYMQYFCGEAHFQHEFPFDPSDFVHFRKRIGESGIEKIFKHSVELHGKQAKSKMVLSDTTVQENNTTFPTDAKLSRKVIEKCNTIANKEGIKQRQTYKRISKQLLRDTYNCSHPKRTRRAKQSQRKLRTLAGRQLRELERSLTKEALDKYAHELQLYWRVIQQKKSDKNKVYSLHKPFTSCIAKGKPHKPYEFGNKVGLLINPKSLVILGIEAFEGNPHDSQTIEPLLNQVEKNFHYQPQEIVYDRGGRGKKQINGVEVNTPGKALKGDNQYTRLKKRKKFRRRAAIEPVIGHLKQHFRMGQNYLHGDNSPKINAMMAAAGWNFKKLMKKIKSELKNFFFPIFYTEKIFQFTLLKVG